MRALRGPVDERRFENNPLLYLDFIFYFSNLSHPKLIYLTLVTPSPPRLNLVEPFIQKKTRLHGEAHGGAERTYRDNGAAN